MAARKPGSYDARVAPGRRADAPARSAAQRLEALRRANAVRTGRAQLKKNLTSGGIQISDILATPPECARTQKVDDLLLALPKTGPVRVSPACLQTAGSARRRPWPASATASAELIDRLSN
jgi:hypothetical protein